MRKPKKAPRIVVELRGGCVACIYGGPLPLTINFVVRDMDDVEEGGPDPLAPDETFENPVVHY